MRSESIAFHSNEGMCVCVCVCKCVSVDGWVVVVEDGNIRKTITSHQKGTASQKRPDDAGLLVERVNS